MAAIKAGIKIPKNFNPAMLVKAAKDSNIDPCYGTEDCDHICSCSLCILGDINHSSLCEYVKTKEFLVHLI